MLPLLDPSVTPNTFYHHEPFLFWAIVSTGSQRYVRQPTLAQALSRPVMQLALQSLLVRSKPIERMKALILLLNWPVPNGMFYKDPSFLLVGTLLHMAMQCGLHAPSFSQDFSKTYSRLPENELIRRAEMWAYVVITYQRSAVLAAYSRLLLLTDTQDEFWEWAGQLVPVRNLPRADTLQDLTGEATDYVKNTTANQ
jgi:transcriptional regulatory protein LEU3